MRFLLILALGFLSPFPVKADALLLEDFAVFQGVSDVSKNATGRAEIVACLQGTKTPRSCIGLLVRSCEDDAVACEAREASIWEHYGYDIYLALRRSLGGPDWIDEAHRRIGAEMVARCETASNEAVTSCQLREAAGRALDLRFALVAP
ncbi:MAG: hypothetical protein HKP37_06425 [Boseongicola sp.]|nr:hypothetical protein [Boseongicola sp.]NNL18359.1 hypothetical protein [Boseongicola sp.]